MRPQTTQDLEAGLDGFRSDTTIATDSSRNGTKKMVAVTIHRVGEEAKTAYEVVSGREFLKVTNDLSEAIRAYVEDA